MYKRNFFHEGSLFFTCRHKSVKMPKKILLVGIAGNGKSTLGNCLVNQRAEMHNITSTPFDTSDGASGCTQLFQEARNNDFIVLDTVGFGDPKFKGKDILEELKKALKKVDHTIDCVVYVFKKNRFTNEAVRFFKAVQEDIFKGKLKNNSILLISNAEDGWLDKQKGNAEICVALENCNNVGYDFKLKLDASDDDFDDKARNHVKRKEAIGKMTSFVKSKCRDFGKHEQPNLAYIQTAAFEKEWKQVIAPNLGTIMLSLLGEATAIISAGLMTTTHLMVESVPLLVLQSPNYKVGEVASETYKMVKENCSPM